MAGQRNRGQNQQNQQIKPISDNMFSLIPKFSGAASDDFSTFIKKFNEVTSAMHAQNDQKLLYLPLWLEDYAHSTFENEHLQSHFL